MKAQVFLVPVIFLTIALFGTFLLLTPVHTKIIKIKESEFIYQSLANAEKGLEAGLLEVFKGINLNLDKQTIVTNTSNCGGMSHQGRIGKCIRYIYQPRLNFLWTNDDLFRVDYFRFITQSPLGEVEASDKAFTDGKFKNFLRSLIFGRFY